MALTIARVSGARDMKEGNQARLIRTITFDNSYATGGVAFTAKSVGLLQINEFIPHGAFTKTDNSDAVVVKRDRANNKLLAYRGDGGTAGQLAQVPNATDLSAYSGTVTILGF